VLTILLREYPNIKEKMGKERKGRKRNKNDFNKRERERDRSWRELHNDGIIICDLHQMLFG
jgi:hypothetical protein